MSTDLESCLKELENINDRLITLNFYYQNFLTSPISGLMFMEVSPIITADNVDPLFDIF